MKILHTSDWHLNAVLGRQKRNEDLSRALAQIAAYLDEHAVDVMLVSGDIFRERSRPEQIEAGVSIIKQHFQTFVERGGTIIVISGNHDSEVFFQILQKSLEFGAPIKKRDGNIDPSGRFYVVPHSRLLRLADEEGNIVQFVLMPYPTTRYLKNEALNFQSLEERNRRVKEGFLSTLQILQRRLVSSEPSILMSHVWIRGMQANEHYTLNEGNDVVLDPSDLPTNWAYIALGHIHKPQLPFSGAEHIRYAGNIERMDYGEREDEKSVVLFEIQDSRLLGTPQILPLESTPIYQIEITDPEQEIPLLEEKYPDAQQALVHYILHWDPTNPHLQPREVYCQQIEQIFPRWYNRSFKSPQVGSPVPPGTLDFHQSRDIAGTIHEYVTAHAKPQELQELLQLADQLLLEEGLI